MALQVDPATCAASIATLPDLALRLTKAHAKRLGMHPYALHSFTDDLELLTSPFLQAEKEDLQCRLLANNSKAVPEHVDTGLFNMVLGTSVDLGFLSLRIEGEQAGGWAWEVGNTL